MSNKTLKVKRIFAYSIYNSLRNTPPKDFPTTGEIKETIGNVLPSLKEHVTQYTDLTARAEGLSVKVAAKELTEEQSKKSVDGINVDWKKYTAEHGQEICEVKFSEEGFKTLRAQFEREKWGSKWTANLDEFSEVMAAFSEAGK